MDSAQPPTLEVPDHIVWKELGGEMVLLNLQSGEYLTLSETAAFIYLRIARGDGGDDVLADMLREYDGTEAEMKQAMDEFLGEMVDVGYLIPGAAAGG